MLKIAVKISTQNSSLETFTGTQHVETARSKEDGGETVSLIYHQGRDATNPLNPTFTTALMPVRRTTGS